MPRFTGRTQTCRHPRSCRCCRPDTGRGIDHRAAAIVVGAAYLGSRWAAWRAAREIARAHGRAGTRSVTLNIAAAAVGIDSAHRTLLGALSALRTLEITKQGERRWCYIHLRLRHRCLGTRCIDLRQCVGFWPQSIRSQSASAVVNAQHSPSIHVASPLQPTSMTRPQPSGNFRSRRFRAVRACNTPKRCIPACSNTHLGNREQDCNQSISRT